jgi:hypothetical protein
MNKGSAVRSVDDFTAKVRGPLTDMRKEQYTSPFDNPIEWGAPTSVEGGDAGTRHAPSGTTHPSVKMGAGVVPALSLGLRGARAGRAARAGASAAGAGRKGGILQKGVDAVRGFFGSKPKPGTAMDKMTTAATPALLPSVTPKMDPTQIKARQAFNR